MESNENSKPIGPHTTIERVVGDEVETVSILVPQCCREGWPTCPHVIQRPKPARKNVGL